MRGVHKINAEAQGLQLVLDGFKVQVGKAALLFGQVLVLARRLRRQA
jgi:hypothetical protein